MKKSSQEFTIVENVTLNHEYFVLHCKSDMDLSDILAGQFVQVKVEKSASTFLRRPISIHEVDAKNNILSLMIRVAGEGTLQLSKLKSGELLDIILPLGNGFSIPTQAQRTLLVGGGCGIAPLLILSRVLKSKGITPDILIGGRDQNVEILTENYKKYGKLFFTTEDGSVGTKGFVTDHKIMKQMNYDRVYTCGPDPMMKAVARVAEKENIPCEVSLENMMACGIGACLCCVTETKKGNKCVCTEGPVFLSTMLKDFTN